MKQVTQINCVCCPNGCLVTIDESADPPVSGNRCPNGSAYALSQLKDAFRRLEAEVRVRGGAADRCPVKGDRPVPVSALEEIGQILRTFEVRAPVCISQTLIRDIAGTGVNVVASRSVPRAEDSQPPSESPPAPSEPSC